MLDSELQAELGKRIARTEALLRMFRRDSAAAHRRRCAIHQGVRETDTQNCQHDWDPVMQWCRRCGLDKFETMENRHA
jgi:hypothetical protein